jgi:TnpA family transposase
LAHLLGIQLQPRIRNWKGLHFFRSNPDIRYEHIDLLFTKRVDWNLIETMLPEMLRVAVSIGAGKIKPSTILRRLATYSRKNKLYFAFRELGYVVHTVFLLEYVSDVEPFACPTDFLAAAMFTRILGEVKRRGQAGKKALRLPFDSRA